MEGPKVETLIPRVKSILSVILSLMGDRSVYVRQTANWCFGRICSCVPQGVAGVDFMQQLRKSLFEQSSIAHYACWSISSLATFYGQNKINSPLLRPEIVPDIVKTLLERAEKQDADARVVSACFEAINQLISNGPKDSEAFKKMVNQLLPGWIDRIVDLSRPASSSDHHQNMLAATLSTLNVSLNVLGPHCLDQKSTNRLMDSLIGLGATNQVVIEEALLCISYVCYVVGDNFFNYFRTPQVQALLVKAVDIDNHKNPNLCQVGAAVIGDCLLACTNSIKKSISTDQRLQKFTDEIVRKMLTLILHMDFPLEHKPHLLGTLTDVGIAFGPFWERYTNVAINNTLAELPPDPDTEDVKAMTEIRETLVDMCRATMLAMSEKGALPAFGNFLGNFLKLLQAITKDPFRTEREVKIFLDFIHEMIEDFRSKPNTKSMLAQLKVSTMHDFLTMAISNPNLKPFAQQVFQLFINDFFLCFVVGTVVYFSKKFLIKDKPVKGGKKACGHLFNINLFPNHYTFCVVHDHFLFFLFLFEQPIFMSTLLPKKPQDLTNFYFFAKNINKIILT
ncbi:importin subunit beta [Reticulomyxa filosa]|uniref:Importin subunit beta n=1 Tax=Reticulomyxa filosa TaxID=46433 RepID=X6NBM7_RETFI|nr:importin subunit beta [Reticulomyxa filosa]|eukprot:ETO23705.1 importin subunit beta [Reticulomyxa filosa]